MADDDKRKDPYAILGVTRTAATDEIRTAYKRLAREHHPDVNPDDHGAEERFKEISWAKEILLDDQKRKLFDEFGVDGLAPGFDPEQARAYQQWSRRAERSGQFGQAGATDGIDMDELLSQLFGAERAGGADAGFDPFVRFGGGRPRRGADLHAELEIDLLDVVRAGTVELRPRGRPSLEVRIPPGARDGTRLRLEGQGEAGPAGGAAGDLYVHLRLRPHPHFQLDGDDLRIALPVTLPELILGGEIEVPTPDGPIRMNVPPRSKNGQQLRVRDKGAKKRGGGRGNLYVQLEAVLPSGEAASEEPLRKIAHELESLYEGDVRARLRGVK